MSESTPPPAAMIPRPSYIPTVADDVELQKLWLAIARREWRSIAVIAGSKGLETLEVANLMGKIAWWYRGLSSCVFDFRDLGLRLLEYQLREVATQVDEGHRAIIALRSIFENPTAIPLAQAADCVILCVGMGRTQVAAAEKTIDEVGRSRFVGTIILDPNEKLAKDAT